MRQYIQSGQQRLKVLRLQRHAAHLNRRWGVVASINYEIDRLTDDAAAGIDYIARSI